MERRYRPAGRGSSRFLGYRYPQDENDPNQYGMGDLKADLAFARFVDNDHVVTFNREGPAVVLRTSPSASGSTEYTGVSNSLGIDTTVTADGTAVLLPPATCFTLPTEESLAVWPGTRPTG